MIGDGMTISQAKSRTSKENDEKAVGFLSDVAHSRSFHIISKSLNSYVGDGVTISQAKSRKSIIRQRSLND
jgi:hypothetical protein